MASSRSISTTGHVGLSGDPELQQSVTKRLDTFQEFPHGRIGNMSVSTVADVGFAYDRTERALRCVWCGLAVPDWQSMESVSVIQQLHNDRCPRGPLDETTERSTAEDQIEGRAYSAEIDLSWHTSGRASERLRRENQKMKEERTCKRCGRSQVETLFLPCRHLVACEVCADEVEDCFICDTKILGTVRTYML